MTPEEEGKYLQRVYWMTAVESNTCALLRAGRSYKTIAGIMGMMTGDVHRTVWSADSKLSANLRHADRDGYIWVE